MAYFIKSRNNRNEWYWVFYATNGEAISRSSEGYLHELDCDRSIQIVKQFSANAEVRRAAA